MKKYLLALVCLLLALGKAHAAAPVPLAYTSTSNPQVQINVTPTTPLPIGVYDQSNTPGSCLTSNGNASPATFQACSGGGGGSSIAIAATTTSTALYPMFAITTGSAVATVYIDKASPWSYTASTGLTGILGITTTAFTDNGNASLNGTTTITSAQITGGNGVFTNLTGTTISGTNANISNTTTTNGLQVTGNAALSGTTTISTAQILAGNATLTNLIATTVTGTTGHFPTLTFTTGTGTNLSLSGTVTASGLSSGTVAGGSYLGLNAANQVVLGSGGSTSPGGSATNVQYNTGSGFGGASGLNVSTTRGGLDFLANTTTANLLSLGDNGADVSSYALGESALLALSTTNRQSDAIGAFALDAQTTGTNNNAFGDSAGQTITTGQNNTVFGDHVGSTTLTVGSDNILIGVNNAIDTSTTATSNTINIGGTGGSWVNVSGTNTNATEVTTLNGALNSSVTSATAFTVGQNGTTTPALVVDTSTAASATGISIKSAAAGATTTIQAIDSSAASSLEINSKGTGNLTLQIPSTGGVFSVKVNGGTQIATANSGFNLNFAQGASGQTNPRYNFGFAADTGITASTLAPQFEINGAVVRQHATGSLVLQEDTIILGATDSFVGASTLTNGATLDLGYKGCGTNATCTNESALYIPSQALTVTGTVTNSYGINVAAATGATNNYAATFQTGNVGIGTTAPTDLLDVAGGIGLTTTAAAPTNGAYLSAANTLVLTTSGTAALTLSTTGNATVAGSLSASTTISTATTLKQGTELSCSTGLTTDASGNINGCVASDQNLKTNVQPLVYDPSLIDRLQPVSYEWREPARYDDKKHSGFIAQQVQIVDPLAVKPAGKDLLGLDNSALAADIVLDLQNIHKEIDGKHIVVSGHKCFMDLLICAD